MEVKILHLIEGAKQARGLTVIIDVFRAFSVVCYAFGNGAERIIPVGDIDIAHRVKKENSDFLLIGERDGKKPVGFDYGNSPTQIENVDFADKTLIQTTSSGTQGIANATNADEIITGSFVNVQAIINYIKKQNPENVSLVAMGSAGTHIADEDKLCAEYIKNALENKTNDFSKIINHLRGYWSAHLFFDPTIDWAPERDFDLCLSLNKFNFVLKVEPYKENQVFFKKIEM
ncbi:MAG: 2-phosphosulfolactate phosphatase [archaeon]